MAQASVTRKILYKHSRRLSSKLITPKSNILCSSGSTIKKPNGPLIIHQKCAKHDEFPGGRYSIPSAAGSGKRPSIRVGGGGISMGPDFEPETQDLPWQPVDIHPERPPPGYMNIDGFYDDDVQVDGKRYQHSLFVMPQFVTKWHANRLEDVTPEHFALATIHYPSLRHVFVGCGYAMPCPTPPEWVDYLNKYKITVEICALATAARLFNMQNTLFQNFACALIYERDVVRRFHNLVKKTDLGMEDPYDDFPKVPEGGSYYHGWKKWE
eukprot:403434_1